MARIVWWTALAFGVCTSATVWKAPAEPACVATQASYTVAVPGRPFAVRELPGSTTALVSINPETPLQVPGIAVLDCKAGRFVYSHTIPLSPQPTGLALTPDGKLLIVADDSYIAFLRTDRLSKGSDYAIAYAKAEHGDIEDDDAGAAYVSVAPDGRYAFVSEEQAGTLTVIDLRKAETASPGGAIVGDIDVGNAPITTLFSSDGKTLYGTVESARRRLGYSLSCRPEGAAPSDPTRFSPGAVFSLDVAMAERASGRNFKVCRVAMQHRKNGARSQWAPRLGDKSRIRFRKPFRSGKAGGERNVLPVERHSRRLQSRSGGRDAQWALRVDWYHQSLRSRRNDGRAYHRCRQSHRADCGNNPCWKISTRVLVRF